MIRGKNTLHVMVGFLRGIRYFDILILLAFPTMGAVFAIDAWSVPIALRFVVFCICNAFFLAHVFSFNDISGAHLHPDEPEIRARHALKNLDAKNRAPLFFSIVLLAASLVGYALLDLVILFFASAIAMLCALYSHHHINLKGVPVASALILLACPLLYFYTGWIAFAPFTAKTAMMGIFFATVLLAGHFSNEIQDFEQDRCASITTNAIRFGKLTVFRFGLVLFVASSAFLAYVSYAYFDGIRYFIISLILLGSWLAVSCAFWRTPQSIESNIATFRSIYRVIYAAYCLAVFVIRGIDWISIAR